MMKYTDIFPLSKKNRKGDSIFLDISNKDSLKFKRINSLGEFLTVFGGVAISVTVNAETDYPKIAFFTSENVADRNVSFKDWFNDAAMWEKVSKCSEGVAFGELTETGNYFVYLAETDDICYFDHDDLSVSESPIARGFPDFIDKLFDKDAKLINEIYYLELS